MDNLNSQQIVLLTLLVSFVTSIATGITTVALLEQAPDPVTQTINRVVEKTIERVVSEPSENTEIVIEKEIVTIVVNEEDLTIDAVEKNSRSVVRIYSQVGESKNFLKLGIVINSDGTFVTDATGINDGINYVAVYQSGQFPVVLNRKGSTNNLAVMEIKESEEVKNPRNFRSAVLANSSALKLGQSVISLSGENRNSVSTGIINSFENDPESNKIIAINTSVSEQNVLLGSTIINLQGEILGLRLTGSTNPTSFISINVIKNFLAEEVPEVEPKGLEE